MTRRPDIPTPARATPTLTRFTQLTASTLKPATKAKPALLEPGVCGYIAARIAYHLETARNHDSTPDGYPSHTSGSDPSTGHTGGNQGESVPLTSVESAVVARGRHRDPHTADVALAYSYLVDAVHALAALQQTLQRLDHALTNPDGLGLADDRWCENHLRHGITEPRARDGSRNCRWCATINRNLGAYPNATLIDYRHRNGTLTHAAIRLQFPDWKPDTKPVLT